MNFRRISNIYLSVYVFHVPNFLSATTCASHFRILQGSYASSCHTRLSTHVFQVYFFLPIQHRHRYHIVFGHFDWTPSQESSMLLYFRAYLQTPLSSLSNSCSTLFHRNIVTFILDSSSRSLIYTRDKQKSRVSIFST